MAMSRDTLIDMKNNGFDFGAEAAMNRPPEMSLGALLARLSLYWKSENALTVFSRR